MRYTFCIIFMLAHARDNRIQEISYDMKFLLRTGINYAINIIDIQSGEIHREF